MSAPIRFISKSFCSTFLLDKLCRQAPMVFVQSLNASQWNQPPHYDNTKYNSVEVGLSPDGSTVLCWHPEPKFPYEHSRELPRQDPSTFESDSVLRVQHLHDEAYRYRPDGPTDSELAEMFRTTKHPWFPRPQRKYIKPNPPSDRSGL